MDESLVNPFAGGADRTFLSNASSPDQVRHKLSSRDKDLHEEISQLKHAALPIDRDIPTEEYSKRRDATIMHHRDFINSMKQILILTLDEHDALLPLMGAKREMLAAALDVFLFELICKVQDMKNNEVNHLHQVLELKEALRKQADLTDYYKSQVKECDKKIHDFQVQLLLKDGLVNRREDELDRQRERFYKEVSVLKEMLYRKEHPEASSKERRHDDVEFVDWKAELEKSDKAAHEKIYKDSPEQNNSSSREIQKYKQQIQQLNSLHTEEMNALKKHMEEKYRKLEEKLLSQSEQFDTVYNQVGDASKEVDALKQTIQNLEKERSELQAVIKEQERKILHQQDIECQLQGTISSKLHEIDKLKNELQVQIENAGFIMYEGERIPILEARRIINDAQLTSKSLQKSELRMQTKMYRLQFMHEEVIMRYCRFAAKYSNLEKQYDIKCAQLRDKTKSLDDLTLGNTEYITSMVDESKRNSKIAQEMADKSSNLETTLSMAQHQLKMAEERSELQQNVIHRLEKERNELQEKYWKLEEKLTSMRYRERKKKSLQTNSSTPQTENHTPTNSQELNKEDDTDVFTRIQKRHEALDNKKKVQRSELFKERQTQLEKIIDSAGNLKKVEEGIDLSPESQVNEGKGPLQSQISNYWKDLRSFLSKEIEIRQQHNESKQNISNLITPPSTYISEISLRDISASQDEQNAISVQIPISPRPKTARPFLRKSSSDPFGDYTRSSANNTPRDSVDLSSSKQNVQVPHIPFLHATAHPSKIRRPSTARLHKGKKPVQSARESKTPTCSDRASRRYTISSARKNKPAHSNIYPHSEKKSSSLIELKSLPRESYSTPKTPRALSARRQSGSQPPTAQPLNTEYILQASRQVRSDHNQRKKVIWKMQFKEEEPTIDGSQSLISIPIHADLVHL